MSGQLYTPAALPPLNAEYDVDGLQSLMGLFEKRKSHEPTRRRTPDLSARYLVHGLEVTITFYLIIKSLLINNENVYKKKQ